MSDTPKEDVLSIIFVTHSEILRSKTDRTFLALLLETKEESDDEIPIRSVFGMVPQQAIDIGKNLQAAGEELLSRSE